MAGILTAGIRAPSALDAAEARLWQDFQARGPGLRSAFHSLGFALACERAHGRARVAVLRQDGGIRGFFPFQFADGWARHAGLAERIGGALNDHAGVVHGGGLSLSPETLLRACRIGGLHLSHLDEAQRSIGLTAQDWRVGHVIDIADGPVAYFAAMSATNREFRRDTERRLRRAEREFGPLRFTWRAGPRRDEVMPVIDAKRRQYGRTGVADPFAKGEHLRLVEALIERDDPACRPVLATLAAGERPIAQHFGLLHDGCLSYWFPVHDPAARHVSPGRLLLWHTIRSAAEHGIRLIDRGEGDTQAKRDFSTGTRRYGIAYWQAPGWRGHAARIWQSARWRLRLGD